jgi:small-conductance mechanosensitive channel
MNEPSAIQQQAGEIGLLGAFRPETALVVGGAIVLLVSVNLVLGRLNRRGRVPSFFRHSVLVGLTIVALVAIALTLRDPVRDQVLTFLGILFTAVLALSSTTLIGNGLAGIMLRAQRHFRGGDWVKVDEIFGQAVHRGLFFTTVQNEFKDLVTLPNAFLASRPLTVFEEPTYIGVEVSLGYDVPRSTVERLLLGAAQTAGLEKPYVYVVELGDFAIRYRLSGELMKTDELLTSRSNLRCRVLDALHAGGIEIVSPNFMNQRVLGQDREFIPPREVAEGGPAAARSPAPEAATFDRGRQAKTIGQLEDAARIALERVGELRKELDKCDSKQRREELRADLEKLERGRERVAQEIREKQAEVAD